MRFSVEEENADNILQRMKAWCSIWMYLSNIYFVLKANPFIDSATRRPWLTTGFSSLMSCSQVILVAKTLVFGHWTIGISAWRSNEQQGSENLTQLWVKWRQGLIPISEVKQCELAMCSWGLAPSVAELCWRQVIGIAKKHSKLNLSLRTIKNPVFDFDPWYSYILLFKDTS